MVSVALIQSLTSASGRYGPKAEIESAVRYLGIEVDDAIEIAEKIDIGSPLLPREQT